MRGVFLAILIALVAAPAAADQTQINNYTKARQIVWRDLYPTKTTGRAYSDLYCGFEYRDRDDIELQVEHVYPANWMGRHLNCGSRKNCQQTNDRFNRMEADLHNLWPAAAAANQLRSNHSFAIIHGEDWAFEDCDIKRAPSDLVDLPTKQVVEPRPIARGNVARSILYMVKEYGLPLEPRLLPILRQWNHSDPVSADERRRNDLVEHLQGTRNPFIDNPSLADGEF